MCSSRNYIQPMDRRSLLKGGAATLALSVGHSMFGSSKANAEVATTMVVVAAVKAAIGLAHSIGLFGDTSGGSALRMESINIRLNQILRNQELLLDAIGAVYQAVSDVKIHIDDAFKQDRLLTVFDDSDVVHTELTAQLKQAKDDATILQSKQWYESRFFPERRNIQSVLTRFQNRMSEGMGSDGLGRAIAAMRSSWYILEMLKIFTALEYRFDANVSRAAWKPAVDISTFFKQLDQTMEQILANRLPEALSEQENEIHRQDAIIARTNWKGLQTYILGRPPTADVKLNSLPDGALPAVESKIALGGVQFVGRSNNCQGLMNMSPDQNDGIDGDATTDSIAHNIEIERYTVKAVSTSVRSGRTNTDAILAINLSRRSGTVDKKIDFYTCGWPSNANVRVPSRLDGEDTVIDVGGRPASGLQRTLADELQLFQVANTDRTVALGLAHSVENLIEEANEIRRHIKEIQEKVIPNLKH